MELRTTFNIEPSAEKAGYGDRVLFIGSCFASSIGSKMAEGRMPVMINPAGTVYNPASVAATINIVAGKKEFKEEDLYCHEGTYLSFLHYTDFSSDDPGKVLQNINRKTKEAGEFISSAKFLFVTFGTARIYRWKADGMIVSNCHKIPPSFFEPALMKVDDIVKLWFTTLDNLHTLYPGLRIVFTISPVRHWKDGAHGNQISKAVLFLAVEELLKHPSKPGYFPAYELIMDDLRDYRFYEDDMLHPAGAAIEYIWEAFAGCYLEKRTMAIWREAVKITKARNHRLNTGPGEKRKHFAENMLERIAGIRAREPFIDFSGDEDYFRSLL